MRVSDIDIDSYRRTATGKEVGRMFVSIDLQG